MKKSATERRPSGDRAVSEGTPSGGERGNPQRGPAREPPAGAVRGWGVTGLVLALLCGTPAGPGLLAQVPVANGEPVGAPIRAGTLPVKWETGGPRCAEMPEWQ